MAGIRKMTTRKLLSWMSFVFLTVFLVIRLAPALSGEKNQTRPLRPGEENRGPWWMKETALNPDGQMPSLKNKGWWKKAVILRTGEELLWKEGKTEQENMLAKIAEVRDNNNRSVEVLVWIIDDEGDGSLKKGGDFHDDCYVYDFYRDGKVDVMVDYGDENRDGQADFMEVRFFDRGRLARAWMAFDHDGLGEMIRCYDPSDLITGNFEFNLSGNKAYYLNRYDIYEHCWIPDSLFPLASLDRDGDGLSEKLIRVNLLPVPEQKQMTTTKADQSDSSQEWPEVSSLELSFDLDNGNSPEMPYHYDLGLILSGQGKYTLDEFKTYSPLRRPPQELPAIPPGEVEKKLKDFSVRNVFFSWKECHLLLGDKTLALTAKEEQGLGWSWERVKAPTSSPDVQKWNIRREVAEKSGTWPEFYYSELDHRIHLFGAKSGWWPIGYVAGLPGLGEIRYFDTDEDGYFDRQELYLLSSVRPVLIMDGRNRKVRKIPFDPEIVSRFYMEEVLPAAINRLERLSQAMSEVYAFPFPEEFRRKLNSASGSDKRFLLDLSVLLEYVGLRDHYFSLINQKLFQSGISDLSGRFYGDLYPGLLNKPSDTAREINSEQAWKLARLLSELEISFTNEEDDKFFSILKEIKKVKI